MTSLVREKMRNESETRAPPVPLSRFCLYGVGGGVRVQLTMRPYLHFFAFISWSMYPGAVMFRFSVQPTHGSNHVLAGRVLLNRRTARDERSACVPLLAMSNEEEEDGASGSAYLSRTKLTREQVKPVGEVQSRLDLRRLVG